MNRMIYDGKMDCGDTMSYYFVSKDFSSGAKIFEELYEEDIIEYAAERVDLDVEEDGYEVYACTISIDVTKESGKVEAITITASIKTEDDEYIDLEPADIELAADMVDALLSKVEA